MSRRSITSNGTSLVLLLLVDLLVVRRGSSFLLSCGGLDRDPLSLSFPLVPAPVTLEDGSLAGDPPGEGRSV